MTLPHRLRSLVAALLVFVTTAAAFAQDYTSSTTSGKYEAPPTSGVSNLGMTQNDATVRVTLPFPFPYFGAVYTSTDVCSNGFLQFGASSGSVAYQNTTFPITVAGDTGMVAPYWDALNNAVAGSVLTWTKGTAPSRVFFVSWEGIPATFATAATSLTFQVQLFEANGNILFAYKADTNPTTWGNNGSGSSAGVRTSYSSGIQAPSTDTRYVCPQGTSNALRDHPPADYLLTPKTFTFSGTLVMDRLVSDATGIGNSVQSNVPLAGFPIEVQRADGTLGFTTTTNASGSFSVTTYGLNSAAAGNGSLVVLAQNSASVVRTTLTGAPLGYAFRTNVPFSANLALGTVTLNAAADATGEKRAPFNIALTLQQVRDWAVPNTTDTIPQIDVIYDAASTAGSTFAKIVPPSAAWIRVASAASANRDGWDLGVLRRLYARHLLASIAASPNTTPDFRWDAVSDPENAFAEAFGAYVHAAVSGQSVLVDGANATTATVYDLEGPTPATRKGPDVAAWVAAALFDLVDGAGTETWDRVDGTGTPSLRPFLVVNSLSAPVTASSFYAAWGALPLAGADLSRDFIRHGLIADDASEANDDVLEPASLGDVGVRRSGLILSLYNEDWFKVRLPAAAPALYVDVNFNRLDYDTSFDLEIRSSAGALIASTAATAANRSKPVAAATGAVPAGDYMIRIRYAGGAALPAYSLQAYTKLLLAPPAFGQWTAGRRFDLSLAITGGVPPYTIAVPPTSSLPPGLLPDNAKLSIGGTPAVPGTYSFGLEVTDSGSPASTATSYSAMKVNAALSIDLSAFTGFPLGRAIDTPGRLSGGTPPLAFSLTSGGLPEGLALDAATMHFVGTATTAGRTTFGVDGTDVTGSASSGSTVGVVCVPMLPAPAKTPFAAGDSACGFFFDAVAGSRATVLVKTTAKRAKRTLKATVLAPSGLPITVKAKGAAGSATIAGIPCSESGRYYVILSSAAGDETELQGAVKLALPVAGKSKLPNFRPSQETNLPIGALAGAHLTLTCSADAKSGLKARVMDVLDPSGASVPSYVSALRTTAHGFVLSMDLPVSGTWTVVLGSDSTASAPGTISCSYKLRQPRGVVYSVD